MYVCFTGDHLVLDNQLVALPWGGLFLLLSSFLKDAGLRPLGLSSDPLKYLFLLSFLSSYLGNHIGESLWV